MPGQPSTSVWPGTADLRPDPLNHGWRDYGARVGIWRTIDILDRHGVRASALVNSMVVDEYPRIVEAGVARDWAWLAHGRTNSALHTGFAGEGEERAALAEIAGPEFVRMIRDQYDQLRVEGDGRVLAIALHPFVIGQGFRARYLDEALAYLAAQPDAWLTTSDDIAATTSPEAPASRTAPTRTPGSRPRPAQDPRLDAVRRSAAPDPRR